MTNFYPNTALTQQKGAVTLFTSVILIIAVTLVTFLTARTVLQETKITANNHRTQQAFSSADAAMDFATAYFNDGGFDHDGDGILDDVDGVVDVDGIGDGHHDIKSFYPALPDGTSAVVFYNDSSISCSISSGTENDKQNGLITTAGTSDDGTAHRAISQCVGTMSLLKGGGPKQTLVSGASVGLTGSAQIINRYSDLNVWSAGTTSIGSSSAMNTYIRPPDVEIADLTKEQLEDLTTSPSIPNVQKVSSNGLGAGTDVYMNDTRLAIAKQATLDDIADGRDGDGCDQVDADSDGIKDCTFYSLFFLEDKEAMAELADGIIIDVTTDPKKTQLFTGDASDNDFEDSAGNPLEGPIWVNGDVSINNAIIGTPFNSVLLIINGDLSFSGGTIYGLIYVTGSAEVTGNPKVLGTVIVEGSVFGTGTLTLVYARNVGNGSDIPPLNGTTAVVAGSWHDWEN